MILHTCPNRNDTVRLGTEYLKEMDGWVFCPCDQPLLKRESIENLLSVPYVHEDLIARLHWGDTVGTPIFFGKKYYEELSKICPCWKEMRKILKNIKRYLMNLFII